MFSEQVIVLKLNSLHHPVGVHFTTMTGLLNILPHLNREQCGQNGITELF